VLLASALKLWAGAAAEIQIGFLAAKADFESGTRFGQRQETAENRLASKDNLGVPNDETQSSSQFDREVPTFMSLRSVEIFSGAGGLALGIARAGFEHLAVVEWDSDACRTLRENQRRVRQMRSWPIHNCDVRAFDFGSLPEGIELLAGGVPCQPFSIGGKHLGHEDERNMFPELIAAVRMLRPKAVLVENVRGLARPSFEKYFGYIELMLTYPELTRRPGEEWISHRARLERQHTSGLFKGLNYKVVPQVLNAADYGIPQKRERLFFVAIRADLGVKWTFPMPTHSLDSLLWEQYVSQEYWERHSVSKRLRPSPNRSQAGRIEALKNSSAPLLTKRWRTVRDAICDLPKPTSQRGNEEMSVTHFAIPGARSYAGHTGSPLDEPAKTLKAGVHGVPGGENMLAMPDGSVRYFTIRESSRLQSFPDEFTFVGSWTESMRQIGNAVPVDLAYFLASELKSVLGSRIRRLSVA
jgi:DNA (cytosine-5)-methyltransferase 1